MSRTSQRYRPTRRPQFEGLESRHLLSTFTVDTLSDVNDGITTAGNFSIREALAAADANSGPDIVAFRPSLAGTIRLQNGSLFLGGQITLAGPGADRITLSGENTTRVLAVGENAVALIRGLTIANGRLTDSNRGAGIDIFRANVTLQDCMVINNQVDDIGGGIHQNGPGEVTLIHCTVANNIAGRTGGGIGLVVDTNLTLINSTVSGNRANEEGGGVSTNGGTVTVVNSTITKNRANFDNSDPFGTNKGGGFGFTGGGSSPTLLLNNSIVVGNFRGSGASSAADDLGGSLADSASSHNIIGNAATSGGLVDGANNNIVGNNGAGILNASSVINLTLANNGGPTLTHAPVTTGPAIDSGSNALAVDNSGTPLGQDQRGAKRRIDGDGNGSIIVDRGAVEFGIRPVLTLSGTVSYTENDPPRLIAAPATLSDDGTRFTNLTVTIANGKPDDRLRIRNQGNGAGQIGVSGNQVSFGGTLIGTFKGGAGTVPLVVTLNASANLAATQALIRNVTFQTLGDNPSTASRAVRFVVADSDRVPSAVRTRTVTVIAENDAPTLGGIGGTLGYRRNSPAIVLFSGATVSDPDSTSFAGGVLRFTARGLASDILVVGGPFTQVGPDIRLGGTTVATRTSTTPELQFTFTADATRAIVQQLLGAFRFRTGSNATLGEREFVISVSDGEGGTSNFATKRVNVTA